MIARLFILLLCGTLGAAVQAQDTLDLQAIPAAGFYQAGVGVELRASRPGASIYYTLDGTRPSSGSKSYRGPILLDTTTVVRAVAYVNGRRSPIATHTYLINEDHTTLPVLSVCIDPDVLFHPVSGIFKKGPKAAPKFPHYGANYYSRREFPAHVEFFEIDQERVFHSPIGFKLFGGMSRIFPQKSFSLYASKSRYGNKYFRHRVFPDKDQKKFKRLVLRNSGSDFGETHFRDALITSLGKDMGLEVQAYRPSVVFINGKYWGIYNIREKLTRHYLKENFGYDKDSVNLIEHRKDVQAGSRATYDAMRTFMRNNDLSVPAHFEYVKTQMDVENFMEYQILQIYIDNQDAGGNIKFWRPMEAGGRWRWILFDTDFGLGHYGREGYKNNSLAFHTKPNGPKWPNPPWSTLNLRSLLQNPDFQDQFISRFLDRINYTLDSSYILPRMDSMMAHIRPELPRHWKRWKLPEHRWHREVGRIQEFVRKRPVFMRQFLRERFPRVGEEVALTVESNGYGEILVNEVIPVKGIFQGIYFSKLPVTLEAKSYFGSRFSHWEMDGERIEGTWLTLRFSKAAHRIKAIFVQEDHPKAQHFVLNEISFADTTSGDWLEFYNASNEDLDLTGWTIRSKGKKFYSFPPQTIKAGSFLVLCKDLERFRSAFPTAQNYLEGLPFGLSSKKDLILIYDDLNQPVDSIAYHIPDSLRGLVKTIVLGDFNANNSAATNWKASERTGSPASVNPDYLQLRDQQRWQQFLEYVKVGGITTALFVLIMVGYASVRKQLKRK